MRRDRKIDLITYGRRSEVGKVVIILSVGSNLGVSRVKIFMGRIQGTVALLKQRMDLFCERNDRLLFSLVRFISVFFPTTIHQVERVLLQLSTLYSYQTMNYFFI